MLVSWLDLRRGMGALLVAAGLTHCLMMVGAILYKGPPLAPGQWHRFWDAHAIFFVLAAVLYVVIMVVRSDVLVLQPVLDFAAGLFILRVVFRAVRLGIRSGFVSEWLALFPGLCVIGYGLALRKGIQWKRLELH